MREAARALDDVSDHLGEVLRRADELLAEWSKFGAQVRGQVEREAAAVGQIVDGAVGRVAAQGIDRAITERLRALTIEIERLEQRTRAASRAVVEQRDSDRRILWAVVAGIVLANALLVVLLLRRPQAAPAAEPIRLDATSAPSTPDSAHGTTPTADPASAAGSATDGVGAATQGSGSPGGTGANASGGSPNPSEPSSGTQGTSPPSGAQSGGQQGAAQKGALPSGAQQSGAQQNGALPSGAQQAPNPSGAAKQSGASGAAKSSGAVRSVEPTGPRASPIALPPRPGAPHPHKKLP